MNDGVTHLPNYKIFAAIQIDRILLSCCPKPINISSQVIELLILALAVLMERCKKDQICMCLN